MATIPETKDSAAPTQRSTCSNRDCPDCNPERYPEDEDPIEPAWAWPWSVALLLLLAGLAVWFVNAN